MKLLKFTTILSLLALMAVGCGQESIDLNQPGNGEDTSNTGLLSISPLAVDCRIDERDPEFGASSRSRASVDASNFLCEIINEKGEIIKSFKYAERPTEAIELPIGDYIFRISSGVVPGVEWDTPVYGCEEPFKIVRKQTTTLSQIVCSLLNIKVTISYSEDLLERLGKETSTTATIGDNSKEFVLTETRAAFFQAPQVSNTIVLRVRGTYAADKVTYKNIEMVKEVLDVRAGQYSNILFYIENADRGTIGVSVTIRDWVTDEVITCNVSDLVTEQEWSGDDDDDEGDDTPTGDPSIIWSGYDINKRYSLDDVQNIDLLVSATKGISGFLVQIKSETLTPAELGGVGLCDVLDLCYPKQSYDSNNPGTPIDVEEPLRGLGFAVGSEVLNKTSVTLSITQFIGVLKSVSQDGHRHDFVITVTDSEGKKAIQTLKLQSGEVTEEEGDNADAPTIVWDGHDISQREQIVAGIKVDLLVNAAKGIKSFLVEIKSESLTPDELSGVGLCNVLNLCYPKQSYDSRSPQTYIDVEEPLRGLGFAVGEDVLNKTSVTLSITQFMGVLSAVSGEDLKNHDFVITVTDNDDNTTVKTLMLQTGK